MARTRKTFRKKITTPELIEQINPKNKKLMERYLKNFATKRSPKSVINYRSDLNIFFVWNLLENDNREFVKIRKIQMMDFFDYGLSELKWSPNRFARMHSCLSNFSEWIENYLDDEYEDFRNIVKKIEKPVKETVRKKTVLQDEDIEKLHKYFQDNKQWQFDCLLALAVSCGARVSELARFTLDLIDEDNTVIDDLFIETTEEIKTKGRGLNGKMIKKYILKDTFLPYYHKWLEERQKILDENGLNHNNLFIKNDGEPASSENLRSWISTWSDIVGQPLYAHSLRHRFITFLKGIGLEDDLIVFITGWAENSGAAMVSIYNDTNFAKKNNWKNLDKLREIVQHEREK